MTEKKRIHFTAIGGVIMHNLAIDAHHKGYLVTGSDDEIYDPSKTKLANLGLLPEKLGWYPEKITPDLEAVIVGMHAREDNPELLKAQALGVKIYSFPEYIYQQSQDKQRIVVAGSHGKTTITAIVMHVLGYHRRKFDYLVGAPIEGFQQTIRLSEDAPVIIIEGDEYPSAPFDPTPKFLHYHHHIGLISGIAWDHMNAYPTFEDYITPFEQFADSSPKAGVLILSQDDSLVSVVGAKDRQDVTQIPYQAHPHRVIEGTTYLLFQEHKVPIHLFGEHNMKNISGAKQICTKVGITDEAFYRAIASFKGATNRMQKVVEHEDFRFFRDYAHSPSKLMATTMAVKKQFIEKKLVACLELHTFSSLNQEFLPYYRDTFNAADQALVYYNPKNIEQKQLNPLSKEAIEEAFNHENLLVFDNIEDLKAHLLRLNWHNKTLLMMSSGHFDRLDFKQLGSEIIKQLKN